MANRISRKDNVFDQYIRNTATYLAAGTPKNGARLGLIPEEITSWSDYNTAWIGIYPTYTNPATRTRAIKDQKNLIKKNFITFAAPLLTRMGASTAITTTDRNTLNLPERDASPTRRGQINDAPTVNMTSLAGGRMKIRCRIDQDATRASMHPLADAIEMRYQVGGTQPANAAACPTSFISKKALFTFDADTANDGKKFWSFCRYVNLTNAANNGPWGTLQTGTVQG